MTGPEYKDFWEWGSHDEDYFSLSQAEGTSDIYLYAHTGGSGVHIKLTKGEMLDVAKQMQQALTALPNSSRLR